MRDVTQYPGSCNLPSPLPLSPSSPLSLLPSLPLLLSPSSPLSLFPSLPLSLLPSPFSPSLMLGWRKLTPTLLTRDTPHSATGGETTANGINPHSLTFSSPHRLISALNSHSYTHRYLLLSRAFNTWRLFVAISKQVQTILVPAPVHFHSCSHPCTLPHPHTPHLHTLTPSPWVQGYVSMSLVLRRVFSIYLLI